jgi:hypothetical protein
MQVWGTDTWGEFTCIGKWVPYVNGGGRFMIQHRNKTFTPDPTTWSYVTRWKYLEK